MCLLHGQGVYNKTQNKDIHKLRKRQHQYPEFGHTQGEIKKKPAKKYVSIQGGAETEKTIKTINFDGS